MTTTKTEPDRVPNNERRRFITCGQGGLKHLLPKLLEDYEPQLDKLQTEHDRLVSEFAPFTVDGSIRLWKAAKSKAFSEPTDKNLAEFEELGTKDNFIQSRKEIRLVRKQRLKIFTREKIAPLAVEVTSKAIDDLDKIHQKQAKADRDLATALEIEYEPSKNTSCLRSTVRLLSEIRDNFQHIIENQFASNRLAPKTALSMFY